MPKAASGKPKLPAFPRDQAERAFWDIHDVGDFLAATRPAQVQVSRRLCKRARRRNQDQTMRTGA